MATSAKGDLMEPQDQEPAGDYGYDEVHAEIGRPTSPEAPRPGSGRATQAQRTPELDRDYGYDESHSF